MFFVVQKSVVPDNYGQPSSIIGNTKPVVRLLLARAASIAYVHRLLAHWLSATIEAAMPIAMHAIQPSSK